MNGLPKSVIVEVISGQNALRMVWQHNVDEGDVHEAFQEMVRYMDVAREPVDVVVDISSNPRFPMVAVVSDCLFGPAAHNRMGTWLVVGSNRLAQMIGGIVSKVSKRNNILWFNSEAEIEDYWYADGKKQPEIASTF